MKLLLDTHLLLWASDRPERLSKQATRLLNDPDNALVFSVASIWEVAIKQSLKRSDFRADARLLRRGLLDNGYEELPVMGSHAVALDSLPPRVLLRTSRSASQAWDTFTAIAPETLALLASKNICLIGIDTPSVDPATSQDLPSHHQLLAHGLRVLENLVLDEVAEGDYELIALPLKLTRADASPVRAILRELP